MQRRPNDFLRLEWIGLLKIIAILPILEAGSGSGGNDVCYYYLTKTIKNKVMNLQIT